MEQSITLLLKEHLMKHSRLCGLNCNWRSKEISSVVLFIGNIILRKVFLDCFEKGVDHNSATGKLICLLGDVDINTLCAQTCNCAQQFLNCLQSCALLPTIDKPKRVYNNSATLIQS